MYVLCIVRVICIVTHAHDPTLRFDLHSIHTNMSEELVHQDVKDYYGKRVQNTGDLLTNVCTIDKDSFSAQAKEAKKMIHPDVLAK